ncbi:MAG: hypothetical protein H5T94_00995 [Pseudothermotoga sp.]|nr:hypothetical protein [Pseudothermotoga sp.]
MKVFLLNLQPSLLQSFVDVEIVEDVEDADVVWFNDGFDLRLFQKVLGKKPSVLYKSAAAEASKLIEGVSVTEVVDVIKSDDVWDKRGFQSYKYHPIFQSLHGGFYSYQLNDTVPAGRVFYYRGSKASIVAVEKRYISVIEENPVIWEYEFNTHKVLCIGGYLDLGSPWIQYNIAEVKTFLKNVFQYLSSTSDHTKKVAQYWPRCSAKSSYQQSLKPLDVQLVPLVPQKESDFSLIHEGYGEDYANLCGRRILVNLKENGIFEEVWVHPFKILKNLTVKIDGVPLSEQKPLHRIYPEMVVWETQAFKITSFASLEKPVFMIQFDTLNDDEHELEIDFEIDARIMWPFSESFNCGKVYNFSEEDAQVIFRTVDGMMTGFVKMNKPARIEKIENESSTKFKMTVPASDGQISLCAGALLEEDPKRLQVDFTEELMKYSSFLRDYLSRTVQIETDNALFNRTYELAKIGTIKFLTSVPPLGEGLMAGYASSRPGWFSARPGYAWYFGRDSEWVSMALLDMGDWETVKRNLELLMRYQRVDGKIFHELTTSGAVHYDAADSTPLFLVVFSRYVKHSGDVEFLRENWDKVLKAFEFCLSTDRDGDGLIENDIEGHGWIEGGKLYGSKAELYLNSIWVQALREMIDLAQIVGAESVRKKAEGALEKAKKAMVKFRDDETGLYMVGVKEGGERQNYFTVMTAVAVYMDAMDFMEAKKQVLPYAKNDFSTDWGTRIIGKSSGIFNPNGYHEGTVWPLFTGWVSLAEFKVGATQSAFNHLLSNLFLAKHFAKGYIAEVYHGEVYKPSGICPHQAWSESMAIQPLIEGMLGFRADILRQKISLSPQIPLNINSLETKNLRAGEVSVQLSFNRCRVDRHQFKETYGIEVSKECLLDLSIWIPVQAKDVKVSINNKVVNFETTIGVFSQLLKFEEVPPVCEVVVSYELPFELYAVEPDPSPYAPSSSFRLVWIQNDGSKHRISFEADSSSELETLIPKILKMNEGYSVSLEKEASAKEKLFTVRIEPI